MENIPDFIYFKDLKSRFVRINNAQAVIFGVGKPGDEMDSVKKCFNDILDGRVPCNHENHWLTKEGAKRLIRWISDRMETR